ncbi:hypothetical protein AAVH_12078 [Aphelenchoides avenae]|nr:hypothetical protein AAVH_12078 [Aphelenchus avenae]
MDGNGGLSIEEKGAKEVCGAFEDKLKQDLHVPTLSTGHEKTKMTVMLTADTPLKPFVLLKLKRSIK